MTITLKNPDGSMLEEIGKEMKEGETCIYPTETCYGVGTNVLDEEAVEKIYKIKNRPEGKKLSCIVSSLEMAENYCKLTGKERELCEKFMPGPLTLVAEKKEEVPDVLNDKFVFRVSSNEVARKLAKEAGVPIVATSANLSGASNAYSMEDISRLLRERVDYVIDLGELESEKPSTVAEIAGGEVEIHREGSIAPEEIEKLLSL